MKRLSRKPWASLGGNGDAERTKGQAPRGVLFLPAPQRGKKKRKQCDTKLLISILFFVQNISK